jgi:hypothetical protein
VFGAEVRGGSYIENMLGHYADAVGDCVGFFY